MFARIALDFFPDKEFDYRVPPELRAGLAPGMRVMAPFGKAVKPGTVLSLEKKAGVDPSKVKDIIALAPEISLLDDRMMELLRWVHRYYGGSMGKVIRCAVPAAVRSSKIKEATVAYVQSSLPAGGEIPAARSLRDTAVLKHLTGQSGRLPLADVLRDAGADHQVIKRLEKKGWIKVTREAYVRGWDQSRPIVFTAPKPVLNDEQKKAVDHLCARLDGTFRAALLYGVTGSGKTEVYLRVIEEALRQGKTALVLVPEISLTPQTIDRFRSRFEQPMAVLHSGLSEGERYDQWRLIKRGGAKIVIGARSAVFAPLSRLGVLIVDEEQERSFKQQEAPHYHARDVAVMRAKLEGALIVLASATPSLESYDNAVKGKYELLELSSRVDRRSMPRIEIVDMRKEISKDGKNMLLSGRLAVSLQARLDRKEQALLFLNRRGFHRCLWCPTCDQALHCPHCSITLTYHKVGTRLLCHLCGYAREPLSRCPQCAADMLIPQGHGTQKIEGMIRKLFPAARVARMDADTTGAKDAHRDILSRFALGRYDILIGTQMIAKGHDFPNVTLVGVLNADMGLNVPDFRAAEQTFQLLTQVAGRAGRGGQAGEVIVQTRMPEHYLLAAVKRGDYRKFYEREIALRQELHYPPRMHLILAGVKHAAEATAQRAAEALQRRWAQALQGVAEVFAAVAAPIQKSMDMHRFQVLIKTASVARAQEIMVAALAQEKLPNGVLMDMDADPQVLA